LSRGGRTLILVGTLVLLAGLAMLVARPRADPPSVVPYAGPRGASLARAAGLVPYWQRGAEIRPLQPGTALRPGDVVILKVRTDQPRFLEVRTQAPGTAPRVIFPAGAQAQQVRSGETLPVTVTLDETPGKQVIIAYFAEHAFPVGGAPAPDLLPVTIEIEKEAAPATR
jgi:hypothetical protein